MSQSRTPSKARVSGQVSLSASGTIESEKHLMKDELMGRFYQIPFSDFRCAFLERQSSTLDATCSQKAVAAACRSSNGFRENYDRFRELVTTAKEPRNIYRPLVNLMNLAVTFTQNEHSLADALPLAFTDETSMTPIRGTYHDLKPDIVGIRPTSTHEIDWSALSVVCEYKNKRLSSHRSTPLASGSRSAGSLETPCPQSQSRQNSGINSPSPSSGNLRNVRESDVQLARYMLEMRSAQDTRAAGYGIQFEKDQAAFWYSDTDSTIRSSFIPVDSLDFVGAIMHLARASAVGLGYLPDFVNDGAVRTMAVGSTLSLDKRYAIVRTISRARAMHGRCTSVYLGQDNSGQHYVIKFSWQVVTRRNEADLIKSARRRGVEGIAEVLYSADLRKLSDGRRSYLPIELQERVLRENRSLRVLVLPQYKPLYEVRDSVKFMKACISLLDTIHELYEKANVLHRDVSVNNLMVRIEDESVGVLIDLDLAHEQIVETEDQQGQTSLHRTGTLPFMAWDLLNDHDHYPHYHRHDLESFGYVLIWISGRYEDGREVDMKMFNDWCQGPWATISGEKALFLSRVRYPFFCPNAPLACLEDFVLNLRTTLDQAYRRARDALIKEASKRPRTAAGAPRKRAEPSQQGYSNSSDRSKRKGQSQKEGAGSDTRAVLESDLVYPPELEGFNFRFLRSALQDALRDAELET